MRKGLVIALGLGALSGLAAAADTTPVLVTTAQLCEIAINGEAPWALPANGVRKIELPPGEHVVTSTCGGTKKTEIITVGDQQKAVLLGQAAEPASTRPANGTPVAGQPAPGSHAVAQRTSPPTSIFDLQGAWSGQIYKGDRSYDCDLTFSESGVAEFTMTAACSGPDYTPPPLTRKVRIKDGRRATGEISFEWKHKPEKQTVDRWSGQIKTSGGWSADVESFWLEWNGSALTGKAGGWDMRFVPD